MADVYADQLAEDVAQLALVNAAIRTVLAGGTSYSLDSGQTRQSVTRETLANLKSYKAQLMADISKAQKALDTTTPSGGSVYIRPGF